MQKTHAVAPISSNYFLVLAALCKADGYVKLSPLVRAIVSASPGLALSVRSLHNALIGLYNADLVSRVPIKVGEAKTVFAYAVTPEGAKVVQAHRQAFDASIHVEVIDYFAVA